MSQVHSHLALVTGASRGIGAAITNVLRAQGIEVLTPSRGELDLASPASIEKYLKSPRVRDVDILINNAGINIISPLEGIRPEDWQLMLQVNLTAPLELIRGISLFMKARGWGRIVNISSVFGTVTKEKRAAYSATKSGLDGLTRTCAVELAPFGILVNGVAPGYVSTELTAQNNTPAALVEIAQSVPILRLAQPAEIAELVAFLASEKNSYLTGQTVIADGGFLCR